MFSSFDLPFGTIGFLLVLRRSAVDLVLDLLALFVHISIRPLLCKLFYLFALCGIALYLSEGEYL